MNNPIKFIIFDLDDTIIYSNLNYSTIRNQVAELLDPSILKQEVEKTPILSLLELLKEYQPELYPEGVKRMVMLEEEAIKGARIMDGANMIPKVLKKFSLKSAIYTNGSRKTIRRYYEKFPFLCDMSILTRDDIIHPKPHPEGLIKLMNEYNIPNLNTVYIGDSWIDSIAADKAKIRFILFNSRKLSLNSFSAPPYRIITNWFDFESLLTSLKHED